MDIILPCNIPLSPLSFKFHKKHFFSSFSKLENDRHNKGLTIQLIFNDVNQLIASTFEPCNNNLCYTGAA